MSAPVASKNMFDLLGNDIPEEEQPSVAPRQVIKATTTSKKREEKATPAHDSDGFTQRGNGRGGRGGNYSGNERAYRDRDAGRDSNRSKNYSEEPAPRGGRGGRGSRGGGRGPRDFDRRSGTGREDSEKQADHAWGANKGESEWNDEQAAVELAQKDAAEPKDTSEGDGEPAAPVEEEDKTMTYDAYLAELAARQANLGPPTEIRRPNEGNRDDKWANAKPLAKDEGQSAYILGETKDKTRNRERKTKQLVEIETRYGEPRENRRGGGDRGGRGRGERGGRGGRGGDRGDRDRAPRGERYGGDRHGERGNRGGKDSSNVNINDARSFPALGAA